MIYRSNVTFSLEWEWVKLKRCDLKVPLLIVRDSLMYPLRFAKLG